jgi:chromate transporter
MTPPDSLASPTHPTRQRLIELVLVFLRIGSTAFGGPAAHIAMMRHELVERRRWLDDQHFLDLLGATNLIPGPNSSEMAMHIGYVRAGVWGLIAAGLAFLAPAMLIVLILAWLYVEYGTTPAAGWLMIGIKPVIIPLVALALWSLGQKAVKGRLTALVGLITLVLYFERINFVLLLIGSGLAVMLIQNAPRLRGLLWLSLPLVGSGLTIPASAAAPAGYSLLKLALIFLKIGALLYGSGYVLFAFMHADLVEHNRWLTEQQLVDAIAIGQMTPGPLSTSATFVGYLLDGVPGALIATGAIYLPAFVIVAISNPLIPRLRRSAWAGSFLDGVNVAALGLMAAVTWELARAAFPDLYTVVVGALAAVLVFYFRLNSIWIVLFGGLMGLLHAAV